MKFTKAKIVLPILIGVFVAGCVQTTKHVGNTIDNLTVATNVQYLNHDEVLSLVKGNTLVGESIKSLKHNNYFKQQMNTDGTVIFKIYNKDSDRLMKEMTGIKWSINKEGKICTEQDDNRYCKKITKINDKYLSVRSNGIISASWTVE